MFAQTHFPEQPLSPEELDQYLSKGWFRAGQTIFTTAYINMNSQVYRVFWLRVVLDEIGNTKTYQKLSKLNSRFQIKIQKATITPEKEELYSRYKTAITFEPSDCLEMLLQNGSELNIFNSLEIALYDGEKLIAIGYFDTGKISAAGISCFYDPDYKKYSLGKYLIYLKMLYCKEQQMEYFYLGYFAPGCVALDYKLTIEKESLEYFDLCSEQWHGINEWCSVKGSIEENRQKLIDLQGQLTSVNVENRLFRYMYFQANMIMEFQGLELFDHLMFVQCLHFDPVDIKLIVVYDIRDHKYHLLKCIVLGRSEEPNVNPEEYSEHLLKKMETLYVTSNAKEMAEMIVEVISKVNKEILPTEKPF